jgi:hypothetical protein
VKGLEKKDFKGKFEVNTGKKVIRRKPAECVVSILLSFDLFHLSGSSSIQILPTASGEEIEDIKDAKGAREGPQSRA